MCFFLVDTVALLLGVGGLLQKSFFSEGSMDPTMFEVEELLTDPEQLRFKCETRFVSCGSWMLSAKRAA